MANYLKVYTGTVTNNGTDGTEVSSEHSMNNPIMALLDSSQEESKAIKCAVRCDSGYKTSGVTSLCFMYWNGSSYEATGGSMDKYQLALDNGYTESNVDANATWSSSIDIGYEIADKNVCFWVKMSSSKEEPPSKDDTIALTVKGIVAAAE